MRSPDYRNYTQSVSSTELDFEFRDVEESGVAGS